MFSSRTFRRVVTYNCCRNLVPGYVCHSRRKLVPLGGQPHVSSPSPLQPPICCFCGYAYCGYFTLMESRTIWAIFGFFHLQHHVFDVYSCCNTSMIHSFLWLTFHCMDTPRFIHPFICCWAFGLFLLWVLVGYFYYGC